MLDLSKEYQIKGEDKHGDSDTGSDAKVGTGSQRDDKGSEESRVVAIPATAASGDGRKSKKA